MGGVIRDNYGVEPIKVILSECAVGSTLLYCTTCYHGNCFVYNNIFS